MLSFWEFHTWKWLKFLKIQSSEWQFLGLQNDQNCFHVKSEWQKSPRNFHIVLSQLAAQVCMMMNDDKNLRELRLNVISCFIICTNHEMREWQFSLLFVILQWKISNFLRDVTWKCFYINWGILQIRIEVKHDSVKC